MAGARLAHHSLDLEEDLSRLQMQGAWWKMMRVPWGWVQQARLQTLLHGRRLVCRKEGLSNCHGKAPGMCLMVRGRGSVSSILVICLMLAVTRQLWCLTVCHSLRHGFPSPAQVGVWCSFDHLLTAKNLSLGKLSMYGVNCVGPLTIVCAFRVGLCCASRQTSLMPSPEC